jgi:geranylgeranyl transferase type-2 subunit beta
VEELNREKIILYIINLSNKDGSFRGDTWSEEADTRFSYCAVSALKLLNALDRVNTQSIKSFIYACQNMDCAFGGLPEMESHAAYVFCGVGTLAIIDGLEELDKVRY